MAISTINQAGLTAPLTLTAPVINTVTSAASTALTLQSAGTTAVTIDTSQNVGIGASTPLNRLHVSQSLAGSASSSAGIARISNTRLNTGDGASTLLFVTDEVDGNTQDKRGQIGGEYDGSNGGRLVFSTAQTTTKTMTERMRIDSSGNLLVGTTSSDVIGSGANGLSYRASIGNLSVLAASASALAVGRATTTGAMVYFYYNAVAKGSISTDGSNVAYNTSSDYRLKENIVDLPNALTVISQLKPRQFDWKETKETTTGFIAHELSEVMPQAVTGKKDAVDAEGNPEYQGIDTSFLVATLTAALQELNAKVDAQAAEIQALKAGK